MKTVTSTIPVIPMTGQNVIILEELEFGFERKELDYIIVSWNDGEALEKIAKSLFRDPDEIFLAIFHLGREGKVKRKVGLRRFIE